MPHRPKSIRTQGDIHASGLHRCWRARKNFCHPKNQNHVKVGNENMSRLETKLCHNRKQEQIIVDFQEFAAMKQYRNRIYDTVLWHRLEAKGAVLVEGPKWCGKTTTCLQLAQSVLYMAQPDIREQTSCLRICSLRCFCKEQHRDSSMSGKLHPNCGMLSASKSINATNSISFSLPAQVYRPALQTLPTQEPAGSLAYA